MSLCSLVWREEYKNVAKMKVAGSNVCGVGSDWRMEVQGVEMQRRDGREMFFGALYAL